MLGLPSWQTNGLTTWSAQLAMATKQSAAALSWLPVGECMRSFRTTCLRRMGCFGVALALALLRFLHIASILDTLQGRSAVGLHDVALIVGEQAGQRGDEPHQLFVSGSVVWCKRCGCYGTSRLRGLKGSCRGPPRAGGRAVALRRLLGGTHPENKAPLPRALRLQLTR